MFLAPFEDEEEGDEDEDGASDLFSQISGSGGKKGEKEEGKWEKERKVFLSCEKERQEQKWSKKKLTQKWG